MKETNKTKSSHLILLSLLEGPKHGYEITKYIEEKSQGFFSLSFGSLYPVLHELEKAKLIKGEWEALGESKKKKVYRLTEAGKKALVQSNEEHKAYVNAFKKLQEVKG